MCALSRHKQREPVPVKVTLERHDLTGARAGPDENGHELSELEFDMFFLLLTVAGNETTRNAISGGVQAFIDHPDQWERLRKDPELVTSAADEIARYGADQAERAGTVVKAVFTLAGQRIICIDSPPVHDFTFTPSTSLFVECASEAELDAATAKLAEGGKFMMPPGNYGFSRKFAWLTDRWGVSWQLNLP